MTHFAHPRDLSDSALMQRIEARFQLAGYARWLKVLERCDDAGVAAMTPSDWMGVLSCSRDELDAFLAYLVEQQAITTAQGEGRAAPLRVTVTAFAPYLVDPNATRAVVLYTEPSQWGLWMQVELNTPAWLIQDPATQQLLRRWIASNVTVGEMEKAAAAAAGKPTPDVSPAALHDELQKVRRDALETARAVPAR